MIGGIVTLIFGPLGGAGFVFGLLGVTTLNAGAALGTAALFAIVGVACGIVIIIGAALQFSETKSRVRTGSILILVFAIVGIPFTLFGLLVGGILSIIGAVLGFNWKPSPPTAPPAQPAINRICPNCGRVLSEEVKFCPNCGKQLG